VARVAKDGYGIRAKVYDRFLEPSLAPLRAVARGIVPPSAGWVVLDIGCGTGAALADYQAAGCVALGADPSAAMLDRANSRLRGAADLRLMAGTRVPFPDSCADLVVISLVLHSVDRAAALDLLAEAVRLLRPGGRVLVIDFGSTGLRFPRGWWMRSVTVLAELAAGLRHASNSLHYLRQGGLPSLAAAADLEIEAIKPVAGGNVLIAVLGASRS
jgi:ubiquinone/menaquinone biosynthesis C-methylase UbiE